jgi:hypothetical protein
MRQRLYPTRQRLYPTRQRLYPTRYGAQPCACTGTSSARVPDARRRRTHARPCANARSSARSSAYPVKALSHGNISAPAGAVNAGGHQALLGCPHAAALAAAPSRRSHRYCSAEAALGGSSMSSGGHIHLHRKACPARRPIRPSPPARHARTRTRAHASARTRAHASARTSAEGEGEGGGRLTSLGPRRCGLRQTHRTKNEEASD